VRLLLASSVIYSHSYFITHDLIEADDLSKALGATVGSYAVEGFFFLSGFLVYPSLLRLRKPLAFARARLFRLWPGLAFATFVTVLGGLLVTTTPMASYFTGDTLNSILYTLSFTKSFFFLNGVECFSAKCAINGSLWSLPFEVRCYFILFLLGVLRLAFNATLMRLTIVLSLLIAVVLDFPILRHLIAIHTSNSIVFLVYSLQRLWILFSLGIWSFIDRDRIHLSWWILLLLLICQLVAVHENMIFALQSRAVLIGYAVLCFGILTAKRGSWSASWPDYSYGSYLFGWPVMLVVYYGLAVRNVYILSLVTLFGSLAMAAISWHFIEKPALSWKPRSSLPPAGP
jgi:peptidoglycan/LPS O-acetylase OafA/YrhL